MLALASHEIHFSVLREDIRMPRPHMKHIINKGEGRKELVIKDSRDTLRKKFQFLNIWVLREYLENDLRIHGAVLDLERLIDDFVFICLFVGNDFLPHVPSLEITEGAIDLLTSVYKKEFNKMGGYLTNSFEVDLERVQHFLQVVGSHENAIFKKRTQDPHNILMKLRDKHLFCLYFGCQEWLPGMGAKHLQQIALDYMKMTTTAQSFKQFY